MLDAFKRYFNTRNKSHNQLHVDLVAKPWGGGDITTTMLDFVVNKPKTT
jgi:hypothetical protein